MTKKRRRKAKTQNYYRTAFPRHHEPMDTASRALLGSSQRKLLAKANKLLNEPLIENTPEAHTVNDDRVDPQMIGRGKALRLPWGRGRP